MFTYIAKNSSLFHNNNMLQLQKMMQNVLNINDLEGLIMQSASNMSKLQDFHEELVSLIENYKPTISLEEQKELHEFFIITNNITKKRKATLLELEKKFVEGPNNNNYKLYKKNLEALLTPNTKEGYYQSLITNTSANNHGIS